MHATVSLSSNPQDIARILHQATDRHPLARPLMEFFAYMAPTGLPRRVFYQWTNLLPAPLAALNRQKCNALLDSLDDCGLVMNSKEDIHLFGPVLGVVRSEIPARLAPQIIQHAGQFLLAAIPPKANPTVKPFELNRLSWHARVLAEHALQSGNTAIATNLMQWLDRSGRKLIGLWPDRAINCHQSALNLSQRILGTSHPLTIIRMNNLGETWRRLKEFHQAETCLAGALFLLRQHQKKYRQLQANCLGNLGLLYMDQGRWDQARETFSQAWSMAKTTRGLDDPLVFLCISNLANIMTSQDDPHGVVRILRDALEFHNKGQRAVPHLNCAVVLNNLALAQKKIGQTGEAMETIHQALAVAQKFLPDNHTKLIQIKGNVHLLNSEVA
ncbi:MAG TPA: tetratricopeptide repeat protein [Magnetococcales bacterium]|nr:tetratricopeptide repeat protein [Magnetococcales bacterium]